MSQLSAVNLQITANIDLESMSRGFDATKVNIQFGAASVLHPTRLDETFDFFDQNETNLGSTLLLSYLLSGDVYVHITKPRSETTPYFASRYFQLNSHAALGDYQPGFFTQNSFTQVKDITSLHKVSIVIRHSDFYLRQPEQHISDLVYLPLPRNYNGPNINLHVSCQLDNPHQSS